jgi:solute carrier family 1 (high affinity glutamate transporter) protein 1
MAKKSGQGLLLGILAGIVIGGLIGWFSPEFALNIKFIGDLFLRLLFMLVVPLVFVTMVHGINQFGDISKMGRPAATVLSYYLLTTFISVAIGIVLVNLIQPGVSGAAVVGEITERVQAAVESHTGVLGFVEGMLMGLVPKNVFDSMAEGKVLPIIFFALFFGAVLSTTGKKGRQVIELFSGLNEAIMGMVHVLMKAAPVGIGCIVAGKLGSVGGGEAFLVELAKLAKYAATVVSGLLIHAFVVLPIILYFLAKKKPFKYLSEMLTPLSTAFSTASSAATLPVTMEYVEKAGISRRSAGFVLPLGATINMDGTALYEAVAAIFIAQSYGIDLSSLNMVTIFLTATLAGIGAAAIPEAGLVTMVMVLSAVGIPVEGIGMILVIDWFLDRCRTTVNVWGDACGAAVLENFTAQGED